MKAKVKFNKKYNWSNEEIPLKLIFGIKAGDDLTPGEATIYTMNDFDICQYTDGPNKGKYIWSLETIYRFPSDGIGNDIFNPSHSDICAYLMGIYEKVEKFCKDQGVEVYNYQSNIDFHTLSWHETLYGPFDNLQDLFNAFKFIVFGYVSQLPRY